MTGHAPNWCVHYRSSVTFDECAAGINYDAQFGTEPGAFHRMPCFLDSEGRSKPIKTWLDCPKFQRPTPEEIAAWTERTNRIGGAIMAAIAANIDMAPDTHRVVACPLCQGELTVARSAGGAIRGHCKSPECISWR